MTGYAVGGHVAQLRVYEPLAAFPDAERSHWAAYLGRGEAPQGATARALERTVSVRALAGTAGLPADEGHASVIELDGVTLVCPWRTRVRAAGALLEWRDTVHEDLADAFLPRAVVAAAADELAVWLEDHPDLRTHVLSSTWSVPLRWFLTVEADERSVVLGEGSVRTGRELVYRTAMSRARRRIARALAVLRRSVGDATVVAEVEDLGRWLEEFHPRSLLELDYGGLVHLLDDAELMQDQSARDVAEALTALGAGDTDEAGAAYGRVTARMTALQAVESAN